MEPKLRVWWIPNPPRDPFHVEVQSVEEAKLVLTILAQYDLFLGDDLISSNAGGLEQFIDGEWEDWQDEQGRDIDEIMDAE